MNEDETRPKRVPRRPVAQPESVHAGSAPVFCLPTLRPGGDVPSDIATDWMPIREAVDALRAIIPDRRDAIHELMNHRVLNGEVPITCEALIYERADGRGRDRQKYTWPDKSARLAEQMLEANGRQMAGLKCSIETGTASWVDVTGSFPVNALAIGLHVDRLAIASMLSRRVTRAAAAQPTPAGLESSMTTNAKAKAGRPTGTTQYASDPEIVDRVIALCDEGTFKGSARVTHALKSLMSHIEPKNGSDEAKLKRLRPKVIERRGDLRN